MAATVAKNKALSDAKQVDVAQQQAKEAEARAISEAAIAKKQADDAAQMAARNAAKSTECGAGGCPTNKP